MSLPSKLTLAELSEAVGGGAVAIRAVTRLEPAGGAGDEVFPPTYLKEGRSQTNYAMEQRVVEGATLQTVLLDSVASQANRRLNCVFNPCRESLRCSEMSVSSPRRSSNSRTRMRPASEVTREPWNATFKKPLNVN